MRSIGCGPLVLITRVVSSGASIESTLAQMYQAPFFIEMVRSKAALAAAALKASPSWKVTPSRSLKVQARPSSLTDQSVASAGVNCVSLPGGLYQSSGS